MNVPVPASAIDLETDARELRFWKMFGLGVDWKERAEVLSCDFAEEVGSVDRG
jgi:hypothetical protein